MQVVPEENIAVSALVLCTVKPEVRLFEQFVKGGSVFREHRTAHGTGYVNVAELTGKLVLNFAQD